MQSNNSFEKKDEHQGGEVTVSIVVDASSEIVWLAAHQSRDFGNNQSRRTILEGKEGSYLIEQTFFALPYVGAATCLLRVQDSPPDSISFNMIKSNIFKSFRGSWHFQSLKDKRTLFSMSSYVDAGIPFSKPIVRTISINRLKHRAKLMKELAEKMQKEESSKKSAN